MLRDRSSYIGAAGVALLAAVLMSPACGLDSKGNEATAASTGAGNAASSSTSAGGEGAGGEGAVGGAPAGPGGAGATGGVTSSTGGTGGDPTTGGAGGMAAAGGTAGMGGMGNMGGTAGMGGAGGAPTCAANETLCNGLCVDLETNDGNCGTCGAKCTGQSICVAALCTDCGGATCSPGESCVQNACECEFVDCMGDCANTDSDPEHCGDCGNNCNGGEVCIAGSCI